MRRIYNRPSGVLLWVALYGWRPIDHPFRRGPQLARMASGGEREVRDKAEWRGQIEDWTRVSEPDRSP